MGTLRFLTRELKLRHLRLLVALDDARRLSQVARVLHITQPAVSKTLADIEAAMGSRLFERTPQGLLPTPAGAVLVRSARDVLAELERTGVELEQLTRGQSRSLVIGAMPSSSVSILAPALVRLRAADPLLAVRVSEGITEDLLAQLATGRLDAVIGARFRRALPEGLTARPLYDEPLVFVAAPRHAAARRPGMAWDELAAMPWILTPPTHPLRTGFERALRDRGMAIPGQVINSSMMDLMLRLVTDGEALAFTALRQAQYLQEQGLLRIVAGQHARALNLDLKVSFFTRTQAPLQPQARQLLEILEQLAAQEGP